MSRPGHADIPAMAAGVEPVITVRLLPAEQCSLSLASIEYVYAHQAGQEQQIQRLRGMIGSAHTKNLFFGVATRAGKGVAILRVSRGSRNSGHFRIQGLFTRKECRNLGLATQLLAQTVEILFSSCQAELVLSYILPANKASLAAHLHAGFQPFTPQGPAPERHLCYACWRRS